MLLVLWIPLLTLITTTVKRVSKGDVSSVSPSPLLALTKYKRPKRHWTIPHNAKKITNQQKHQFFNPFTAKFSQKQASTNFPNFILWNFEKQVAPCVSTGRELSFERLHHRILSADSKVRVTLQNSIKHSGSERVNLKNIRKTIDFKLGEEKRNDVINMSRARDREKILSPRQK